MKKSSKAVTNLNTKQQQEVIWKCTNYLNMKGSDLIVTNVNTKQQQKRVWKCTNNQNMKGSDFIVTNVITKELKKVLWKCTNYQNMKESSIVVTNLNSKHYISDPSQDINNQNTNYSLNTVMKLAWNTGKWRIWQVELWGEEFGTGQIPHHPPQETPYRKWVFSYELSYVLL